MARVRPPTGARVSLSVPKSVADQVLLSAALRGKVAKIADDIADAAQRTVPQRTGHLKDSERHGVIQTTKGPAAVIGYLAFYAHMVHNGTVHNPPNPWLLNAALGYLQHASGSAAAA